MKDGKVESMTDGNEQKKPLVDTATEAETEAYRHRKEAAILTMIARRGLNAPEGLRRRAAGLSWRKDHGAIYEAMKAILDRGTDITDILIDEELGRVGVKVGDEVLKDILTAEPPEDTVAEEYLASLEHQDRLTRAEQVGEKYRARIEKAKTDTDTDAAVGGLLKDVLDLIHRERVVREYRTEGDEDEGHEFLDELEGRCKGKGAGLEFGKGDLDGLNKILNGLSEGLYVLAGAPSTGKTTLAKQIADNVAEGGTPVIYWHYEQGPYELRVKSLARILKPDIDMKDIGRKGGTPFDSLYDAFKTYTEAVGDCLKIIKAGPHDNMDLIRQAALAEWHKAGRRPILLVLDYLQIIPPTPGGPDTIRERIDWTLSELRRLSRDIHSPILVISSLNREAYKLDKQMGTPERADTKWKSIRPSLANLKESGGIEYSADVVICLWRDPEESENRTADCGGRETRLVEALVLKNRNGGLGKAIMDFTPSWAAFSDYDPPGSLCWQQALSGE